MSDSEDIVDWRKKWEKAAEAASCATSTGGSTEDDLSEDTEENDIETGVESGSVSESLSTCSSDSSSSDSEGWDSSADKRQNYKERAWDYTRGLSDEERKEKIQQGKKLVRKSRLLRDRSVASPMMEMGARQKTLEMGNSILEEAENKLTEKQSRLEDKCHYLVGNTQELQRRIGDLLGERDRVMSDFIQLEDHNNKRRLELESLRSESKVLDEQLKHEKEKRLELESLRSESKELEEQLKHERGSRKLEFQESLRSELEELEEQFKQKRETLIRGSKEDHKSRLLELRKGSECEAKRDDTICKGEEEFKLRPFRSRLSDSDADQTSGDEPDMGKGISEEVSKRTRDIGDFKREHRQKRMEYEIPGRKTSKYKTEQYGKQIEISGLRKMSSKSSNHIKNASNGSEGKENPSESRLIGSRRCKDKDGSSSQDKETRRKQIRNDELSARGELRPDPTESVDGKNAEYKLLLKKERVRTKSRGKVEVHSDSRGDEYECDTAQKRTLKSPKFDGRGRVKDFLLQFDTIRKYNKWTDKDATFYLFTACQGDALAVLSANDISPDDMSYSDLVEVMRQEFGPRECEEKYFLEVGRHEQQPGESLHDLGLEIKRLTTLAHPRTDKVERDRIAREHFKRAIADPKLKEELFRARPETLSDAIVKAEIAESFYTSEQNKVRSRIGTCRREAEGAIGTLLSSQDDQDKVKEQIDGTTEKMTTFGHDDQHIKDEIKEVWVPASIQGEGMMLCVDSGASKVTLTLEQYRLIPEDRRPPLEDREVYLRQADGSKVKIAGAAQMEVRIGDRCESVEVYIAQVRNNLLGINFLRKTGAVIDFSKLQLVIDGEQIDCCTRNDKQLCSRLVTVSETIIPAEHEVIIEVCTTDDKESGSVCLAEPVEKVLGDSGLVIACAVVDAKSAVIPVKIMNLGPHEHVLRAGTVLARLLPLDEENVVSAQVATVTEQEGSKGAFPAPLRDLVEQCTTELNSDQKDSVTKMLSKYQDVFSMNECEIGQTKVVKHSVNTGDDRPIRQPLRGSSPDTEQSQRVHL